MTIRVMPACGMSFTRRAIHWPANLHFSCPVPGEREVSARNCPSANSITLGSNLLDSGRSEPVTERNRVHRPELQVSKIITLPAPATCGSRQNRTERALFHQRYDAREDNMPATIAVNPAGRYPAHHGIVDRMLAGQFLQSVEANHAGIISASSRIINSAGTPSMCQAQQRWSDDARYLMAISGKPAIAKVKNRPCPSLGEQPCQEREICAPVGFSKNRHPRQQLAIAETAMHLSHGSGT